MQAQPYLKTDYLGFLIDENLPAVKNSPLMDLFVSPHVVLLSKITILPMQVLNFCFIALGLLKKLTLQPVNFSLES